jgi:nicotinamidase-related amidase
MKTALIVIDVQKDFLSDGKLPMSSFPESIIPKINNNSKMFDTVCFVKNEFDENNGKKDNKITISDVGYYCSKGSSGSEFPESLKINDNIFTRSYSESFNSLISRNDNGNTLLEYLNKKKITHLFLCGFVSDYSIKYTSNESIKNFKTYVVVDMVKYLKNINDLISFFLYRKIPFINIDDIKKFIKRNS